MTARPAPRLIDYPFPYGDERHLAWVRLPLGFSKEDAERLKAYIDSLVADEAEEVLDEATHR